MGHIRLLGLGFIGLLGLILFAENTNIAEQIRERIDVLRVNHTEGRRRSVMLHFPGSDARLREIIPRHLTPPPALEPSRGIYTESILLKVRSGSSGHTVRYTLDGSIPISTSPRLVGPIRLDKTTVIRLRSFSFGKLPSAVVSRTFVIGENFDLPVVSLVTDPVNLMDSRTGIYVNPWRATTKNTRPQVHVEFFPVNGGTYPLAIDADMGIHGGYSRNLPKKSFRLRYPAAAVAGTDSGTALTATSTGDYQVVILRSAGNNWRWGIGDELFNAVYSDAPQAATQRLSSHDVPCHLLLNGKYWGRYHIRERIDVDFLVRAVGPGSFDLVKDYKGRWEGHYGSVPEAVSGDLEDWLDLLRWIRDADLSKSTAFAVAESRIDLTSLTDYWLYSIYAGNIDWPMHNVLRFRRLPDGLWKWLAWDSDQTFGLAEPFFNGGKAWIGAEDDTLARAVAASGLDEAGDPYWGNRDGNLLVRKLLENSEYRSRFAERMFELLDTSFRPERVLVKLDDILAAAASGVDRDLIRWDTPRADYDKIVGQVRQFIKDRPAVLRRQFIERFGKNVSG